MFKANIYQIIRKHFENNLEFCFENAVQITGSRIFNFIVISYQKQSKFRVLDASLKGGGGVPQIIQL